MVSRSDAGSIRFYHLRISFLFVSVGYVFESLNAKFADVIYGIFCHLCSILVLYIVVSSEGVSIAIVLVLLRKRVLREIATSKILPCVKVPEKWKTLNDSETVEESDDIERVGVISSRFDNTNPDRSVSPFVERSFANIAAEL